MRTHAVRLRRRPDGVSAGRCTGQGWALLLLLPRDVQSSPSPPPSLLLLCSFFCSCVCVCVWRDVVQAICPPYNYYRPLLRRVSLIIEAPRRRSPGRVWD